MKEININNFDEKLYYEKLNNGLEVFILPLSNTKSFYVSLSVKFGGINRLFKVNGKEYLQICPFYPSEDWNNKMIIADTVLLWSIEWFYFYVHIARRVYRPRIQKFWL